MLTSLTIERRSELEATASRLRAAYAGRPIAPLRSVLEPTDQDGAYFIQRLNTEHWLAEGRRISGRKIGLTAEAVQRQLGVDQPDYGVLFADMEIEDGGVLDSKLVLQPKAEAEVAFVLGKDLDAPGATAGEVAAAVDYAVAAIEIVDSRIADWKITFADTVADNGSSSHYVLGQERRRLQGLDLWSCGMVMEVGGKIASLGAGAACLGHPLEAAAWLARTMAAAGEPLRAGAVLLSGALGPMVALSPGQHVRATIGGLGRVSLNYGEGRGHE